jgi:hypothetical protein
MDETVDGGDRHRLVREEAIPGAEWDVGRDGEATVLVAAGTATNKLITWIAVTSNG